MLPRPARVVRQAALLPRIRIQHSTTFATCRAASSQASRSKNYGIRHAPSPELDQSFRELIEEANMGMGIGMTLDDLDALQGGGRRRRRAAAVSRTGAAGGSSTLEDIEGLESTSFRPAELEIDHGSETVSFEDDRHAMEQQAVDEGEVEEGWEREERRSPAAVLGSKRIGVVVLPEEMKRGIQGQIDQLEDPRQLRSSYLALPSHKKREEKHDHRSGRPRRTVERELAKAAAVLPGEYGVVRNVIQEMKRRLGNDWLNPGQGGVREEVVEFSGGLGSGMWATLDSLDALPSSSAARSSQDRLKIQLVHTSRHGLDLAAKIAEGVPESAAELNFSRKYVSTASSPALVLSTFLLSTLPTQPSQQSHLLQLLSLNASYLILVDRSTPEGWEAISSARSFLLDQATPEQPLHVVAPCPHDGACPLVGTRDSCSFSQRLQRPSFLRKTKHSSRGEEDTGYCYLVLARGERPARQAGDPTSDAEALRTAGRVGGVGREDAERAARKRDGRGVLTEIEGAEGILEVVQLHNGEDGQTHQQAGSSRFDKDELETGMRIEAYGWPRMVAPPMKRSGHVTIDACCPDGHIQRLTFSKSHSRQGYHDARKSSWGDLFPHEPKAKPVIRTRGVRRLTRAEKADDNESAEVIQELMTGEAENDSEVLEELEKLGIKVPKAEIVKEVKGDDEDVTVWKSDRNRPFGTKGQRRGLMTAALTRRQPFTSPFGAIVYTQRRFMSARPTASRAKSPRAKVTIAELHRLSASGIPITCLTAYDYPTALMSEQSGVDMVLVGDSLSQVALGYESTTSITLDEMIHHARAVVRGAKTPFVFADMPFGSFEPSLDQGVKAVLRMVKEGGVDGVKIEGGKEIVPLIRRLSEIGIPVVPHLGLQPQRATSLSGYLVQGRSSLQAYEIYQTAKEMKEAGAFAFLLEAIPHLVARVITEKMGMTIGIGAGNGTSGQVLVITDVLGTYAEDPLVIRPTDVQLDAVPSVSSTDDPAPVTSSINPTVVPLKSLTAPRFVRQFGALGPYARQAIKSYVDAVKDGSFPNSQESYIMKKVDYEGFLKLVGEAEQSESGAQLKA